MLDQKDLHVIAQFLEETPKWFESMKKQDVYWYNGKKMCPYCGMSFESIMALHKAVKNLSEKLL